MFEDKDGFDYPVIQSKEQVEFCKAVCPVNAYQQNAELKYKGIWGPISESIEDGKKIEK